MLPIAADIAVRGTRELATSAMPDAPVIDDTADPAPVRTRRRAQLARLLRAVADRLEPATPYPPTSPPTWGAT